MTQLRDNWIGAQDMVRSRAWREGYESYRRGEPPGFSGRRSQVLAYEYGRLTAAFLKGEGEQLLRVSPYRPVNRHYVPYLAAALTRCANGKFGVSMGWGATR